MSRGDLVDTLSRLTVHNDEELRGLAFQALNSLVTDFPDWREDVLYGEWILFSNDSCQSVVVLSLRLY